MKNWIDGPLGWLLSLVIVFVLFSVTVLIVLFIPWLLLIAIAAALVAALTYIVWLFISGNVY